MVSDEDSLARNDVTVLTRRPIVDTYRFEVTSSVFTSTRELCPQKTFMMHQNSRHSVLHSQDSTLIPSDTDVQKNDLGRTPYNAKSKYGSMANQHVHSRRDILSNRGIDSEDSKKPNSRERVAAVPNAHLQLDICSSNTKGEKFILQHNLSETDILPNLAFSLVDNLSNRQRVISDWGKIAASFGFTVQHTASHLREQLGVLPRSAGQIPLVWNTSQACSPVVRSASFPSPLEDLRKSTLSGPAMRAVKTTATEGPPQGSSRSRSRRPAPLKIKPSTVATEGKKGVKHQKSKGTHPETERIRRLVQLYAKHRVGTLKRVEAVADKVDAGSLAREDIDRALEDWAMYERLEAQFNGRVREWMEGAKENLS